jgi:hypothetical protein
MANLITKVHELDHIISWALMNDSPEANAAVDAIVAAAEGLRVFRDETLPALDRDISMDKLGINRMKERP